MKQHSELTGSEVAALIRKKEITFGGNSKAKIYGRLNCRSGKKLLRQNRVFFADEAEAIYHKYRPCGHCMKTEYTILKNNGPI